MKKLLVSLFAAVLFVSAFTATVLAGDGDDYGPVAKTSETIVIDGVKDAAYSLGRPIAINREVSDIGTRGIGTVLWSDGFLYVFGEIRDSAMMPPDPEKQEGAPWNCDSLEVFIDQNNTGDTAGNVMQYRIDITGWPCVYNQGGLADYGQAAVGSQFEYAHKIVDGGYNVEFKIPISVGEGAQIGIQFQINDVQDADGTQQIVLSRNGKGQSNSWEGEGYGFITLGGLKEFKKDTDAKPAGDFIFIEAESGKNSGMNIASDAGAYSGKCIVSKDAEDTMEYTIDIANPGEYVIWARVYAENEADNSYLYSLNGDLFNGTDMWIFDFYEFNAQPTPSDRYYDPLLQGADLYFQWYWMRMDWRDTNVDPAVWWNMKFFDMKAGANEFLLKTREIGAKIDKFIVTNNLDYDPKLIVGDPEASYLAQLAAEEAAAAAEAAANEEVPAPSPAPDPGTSPVTGNTGIIILFVALAASGFVLSKKRAHR